MFKKVAVANRGAVAARVVSTLREMGVKSAILCSEADKDLPYVSKADESAVIGPAPPKDSYLNREAVIATAKALGAEAIHPGWGFLSEDPLFAEMAVAEGLVFIGPSPKFLSVMGDKVAARKEMAALGLPVSPSTGLLSGTPAEMAAEAKKIGFPLMVKPAGGGGGIGMIPVDGEEKLIKALETAESQALRGFGQAALYCEKLLVNPRHVEFQVVADKAGGVRHLWERDCSIQRRRQKILEEAGAPNINRESLAEMAERAAHVLGCLGYDHLGTVETLYDPDFGFSFLEVNPRLQVEHAVTEEVTGVDLVAAQIGLAAGLGVETVLESYGRRPGPERGPGSGTESGAKNLAPAGPKGHALEARIYAEDPVRFLPSPGKLAVFRPPKERPGLRLLTGYAEGDAVTPYYDPMIAQLIVSGPDRAAAVAAMAEALGAFEVEGLKTNIPFLRLMMGFEPYLAGDLHTGLAERLVGYEGYKEKLEALKC
ncbi:MAG: biotin carboxylase [Deltaproteobacteria bacterium]|jgi:acetyl-CoA carboxylase biotin carboxylase subunit|nr:biotin carboxylase [Deltaproteobacteria bacterium]